MVFYYIFGKIYYCLRFFYKCYNKKPYLHHEPQGVALSRPLPPIRSFQKPKEGRIQPIRP